MDCNLKSSCTEWRQGSSTCFVSEPPACPENVPTVVENLVVGKIAFCQSVTFLHEMSCAETFLNSYGKAFVQTTQKLVCFLPQFVNRMLWVGFNRCSFSLLGIHPPAEWCYQVGKGQKLRVLKSRNEFSEFCILLQCSCYAVVYLIHSCSRNAWVTVWVNLPWCSSHEPFEKLVHHPNEQSAYIIPFPI